MKEKGPMKCIICEGLHIVRDCLKRSTYFAIKGGWWARKGIVKLSSILSCVKANKGLKQNGADVCRHHCGRQNIECPYWHRCFKFVHVWRNYLEFGLKVEKKSRWIKTMNSKRVPIVGFVKGVKLQLSGWIGKETIGGNTTWWLWICGWIKFPWPN